VHDFYGQHAVNVAEGTPVALLKKRDPQRLIAQLREIHEQIRKRMLPVLG
jgi:hypothetical protein